MRFELAQDDGRVYEFEGEELGRTGPPPRHRDRWTVVTIYRTDGGSLIAGVEACSRKPGEVNFLRVHVCAKPEALLESLRVKGRLSEPVLEALDQAAEKDAALAAALDADNRVVVP